MFVKCIIKYRINYILCSQIDDFGTFFLSKKFLDQVFSTLSTHYKGVRYKL